MIPSVHCFCVKMNMLADFQIHISVPLKYCPCPDKLKLAGVSPVYKKENPLLAKSYRPVSVLTTVTKIFERLMQI